MRLPITPQVRRDVQKFYGGNCVVYGNVKGTLHHLNGENSRSLFQHLIPVHHPLHAILLPSAHGRTRIMSPAHGELDPPSRVLKSECF
jgi:hypothetical protein